MGLAHPACMDQQKHESWVDRSQLVGVQAKAILDIVHKQRLVDIHFSGLTYLENQHSQQVSNLGSSLRLLPVHDSIQSSFRKETCQFGTI